MLARHLLIHVGVAAIAVVFLSLLGVAFSTALVVGMMAGCIAMALGVGHTGHDGAHRSITGRRSAPRSGSRADDQTPRPRSDDGLASTSE